MTQADPPGPLSVRRDGDRLEVTGEIDMDTAPLLSDALAAVDGDALVDMSRVNFLDSSGLRTLIEAHQAFEARGSTLAIVDPSPQVARVLDLGELTNYFDVRHT